MLFFSTTLYLLFSIHASAKEATYITIFSPFCNCFSIHASAKEATLSVIIKPFRKKIFNPRLREGGDPVSVNIGSPFSFFQSTPPRRRRLLCQLRNAFCNFFQSTPPRRRRPQHIVIPQLSCAYLVSTTFLSTIFSFISQYIVLFPLFRVRMPCVFCVAYDSHYVPLFNIFYILFQGTPF